MEGYIFWIFFGSFLYGLWYGLYGIALFGCIFWETWGVSQPWKSEGYHYWEVSLLRGITALGTMKDITALGNVKASGFGKVRDIIVLRVCMAWHGFMCRVAWLGMALCVESMAWHGFVCREHGFLWLYLEVAWLGMSLRVVGTYTCTWPKEFELGRIGAYIGMMPEKMGTYVYT